MHIEGEKICLRAVEPEDISWMYRWENDSSIWAVSGTIAPFSCHQLQRFLEEQQFDLQQTRQQRLMIQTRDDGRVVGALDLFELDLLHRRAGIGILIADPEDREQGYAKDAVQAIVRYAHEVLGLHQLWCNVGAENRASRALFAGCGFEECGVKRQWLRTAQGWQDEILLQKIL
ncbi:MAG: GNAT family N-acetyltransferase [Alistipes sp.]|nr:GNAT family N-acetyltransferase [Alistipes sp.]